MKQLKAKKKSRRKKIFKKAASISFKSLVILLVIYSITALSLDPGFFARDSKEKYAQAADTLVSVVIPNKPGKPVLSSSAGCASGSPYIDLSWGATSDTDNYDISRDSLPLITGLSGLNYRDSSVQKSTTYAYKLTSNGPMGETSSDEISATASSCGTSVPAGCTITTIGGKAISSFSHAPDIEDRTPSFTGTSNIANAVISIYVSGHPAISATIFANINGYWSWTVPHSLDYEKHTISVTASSPVDPSYYGMDSFIFKIVEEEEEEEKEKNKKETSVSIGKISPPATPPKETEMEEENLPVEDQLQAPIIYVKMENPGQEIFPGENLEFGFSVHKSIPNLENFSAEYSILNEKNIPIASFSEDIALFEEKTTLKKNILIPKLASPGKYKIFVKFSSSQFVSTGEDYFFIKESPLLQFGGTVITLSDIMKKLSWLIIILFALLLTLLALLAIEHHFASLALRQVTENLLRDNKLISKRKGVLS